MIFTSLGATVPVPPACIRAWFYGTYLHVYLPLSISFFSSKWESVLGGMVEMYNVFTVWIYFWTIMLLFLYFLWKFIKRLVMFLCDFNKHVFL